jgi:hypothetical protein
MTQARAPVDPVAAAVIEGLVRRAAPLQGAARLLVEQRIQAWRARSAAALATAAMAPAPASSAARAALTDLVDRLGRSPTPAALPGSAAAARRPGPAAPAPLKAVAAFQGTWSRLRAEQRLRQALAQVPAKAGPLNSSQVVHRALQAMYDLSPDYLDAFMAHIDTLLWLEPSSGAGDLAPRAHGRSDAAPAQRPLPARRSTAGKDRL